MSYRTDMYMNHAREFIQLFGYEEYDRLLSLEEDDEQK